MVITKEMENPAYMRGYIEAVERIRNAVFLYENDLRRDNPQAVIRERLPAVLAIGTIIGNELTGARDFLEKKGGME